MSTAGVCLGGRSKGRADAWSGQEPTIEQHIGVPQVCQRLAEGEQLLAIEVAHERAVVRDMRVFPCL